MKRKLSYTEHTMSLEHYQDVLEYARIAKLDEGLEFKWENQYSGNKETISFDWDDAEEFIVLSDEDVEVAFAFKEADFKKFLAGIDKLWKDGEGSLKFKVTNSYTDKKETLEVDIVDGSDELELAINCEKLEFQINFNKRQSAKWFADIKKKLAL